jgi:predicted RNase H-like HicB family nuclease/predicted RNA binding protein YcfA (HicA-like mRNA interferase family)
VVDLTRQPRLTSGDVLTVLQARGYTVRHSGEHVVAVRDESRVVLPAPERPLPPLYASRLEHALESLLGPSWLTDPSAASAAFEDDGSWASDEVLLIEAVVDRCEASGQWCAFVPAEPSIMGTAADRDGALRDVKQAAAVWLGVDAGSLALITPDIL